jgi:hypothetical protein
VSLPVNRLAFKCIQSPGYRKVVGYLPALSVLRAIYLLPQAGLKWAFLVDFQAKPYLLAYFW